MLHDDGNLFWVVLLWTALPHSDSVARWRCWLHCMVKSTYLGRNWLDFGDSQTMDRGAEANWNELTWYCCFCLNCARSGRWRIKRANYRLGRHARLSLRCVQTEWLHAGPFGENHAKPVPSAQERSGPGKPWHLPVGWFLSPSAGSFWPFE